MLGEVSARAPRRAGPRPQVPASARRRPRRPHRLPDSSRAGTSASRRATGDAARCRRRSATSPRSSASPRCCRSTPAASASWPVTTSRPPATSACRSSASACSTAPGTSASRCRRRLAARALPVPGPAGPADPARSRTPTARRSGSPSRCPSRARCTRRSGWRQVGRVPLLLLDTDIEENDLGARQVTDRLYGGGEEHRLEQELLLGIGGVRAIRAYCEVTGAPAPEVFHTNEGHAGFLGVERIRELVQDNGLDFDEALQAVRAGTVFTTHTPVPAGIDRFDRDLVAAHLGGLTGRADRAGARARRRGRPAHVQHGAHGSAARPARQRGLGAARRGEPRDVRRPVAGLRHGRGADHLDHQRRARADLDVARDPRDRRARGRRRPSMLHGGGWEADRQGHRPRAVERPAHPARAAGHRGPPPGAGVLAPARHERGRTRLDGRRVRPGRADHRLRAPGALVQAADPDAARSGAAARRCCSIPTGRCRS